jgi:hypothetical protein
MSRPSLNVEAWGHVIRRQRFSHFTSTVRFPTNLYYFFSSLKIKGAAQSLLL